VVVVGLGDAVGSVPLGHQSCVVGEVVGRVHHPEHVENVLTSIVLEDRACGFLENVRGNGRTRVAVRHVHPGLPAADPRVRVIGETVEQGDVRVVHRRILAEVDVVEARGVLHDGRNRHRVGLGPAIGELDLGRQLPNRCIEVYEPLLHQRQDRERRKGLRDGADPEQGLAGDVGSGGDIRLADAAGPDRVIPRHQRDRRTGYVVFVQNLLDTRPELFDTGGNTGRFLDRRDRFLCRDKWRYREQNDGNEKRTTLRHSLLPRFSDVR